MVSNTLSCNEVLNKCCELLKKATSQIERQNLLHLCDFIGVG